MRLARRLRALEHAALDLPAPEPFDLRALARADPEVLRLLMTIRQWRYEHPDLDPNSDPGCVAMYEEIAKRWRERARELGRPAPFAASAAG